MCTSIQQFRKINWIDFYPEDIIGLTRPYVIEWVVIHIMGLSTSWPSVFKWFLPTSLFCSVNLGAVEIVHVVSFVHLKRLENPFLKTVLLISQGQYQGLMLEEKDWIVGRSPCPNCRAFLRFAWMHGFILKHNKKRAHETQLYTPLCFITITNDTTQCVFWNIDHCPQGQTKNKHYSFSSWINEELGEGGGGGGGGEGVKLCEFISVILGTQR